MRRRKRSMSCCRKAPLSSTLRATKSAYLTVNTPQSQPFVCSGMSCAEAGVSPGLPAPRPGLGTAGWVLPPRTGAGGCDAPWGRRAPTRRCPAAAAARTGSVASGFLGVRAACGRLGGRPRTPRGSGPVWGACPWTHPGPTSPSSSAPTTARGFRRRQAGRRAGGAPVAQTGGGRGRRRAWAAARQAGAVLPPHRVQVADSLVHKINHRQHPMHSLRPAEPFGCWLPAPAGRAGPSPERALWIGTHTRSQSSTQ